jgi:hypothetical protein
MELSTEARAILRTFIDRGCKDGDIIPFSEFGDSLPWENAAIKQGPIRDAFISLCDNGMVIEYNSGLGITKFGLDSINQG